MKILFITPSYKPAYVYGGPTISVSELAEALVLAGHDVTVYTTTANGNGELDVPKGRKLILAGVQVYYFKRITGDHTHISIELWKSLWKNLLQFDVVHLHSWWSLLIFGCAAICRRKQVKFVLSPRGMLGNYSFLHQHSLLKKGLHKFIGKRLLASSILHATTLLEWQDCTLVYPEWEGFVLHNLIQLPDIEMKGRKNDKQKFILGFLSRIDPKKGIELLFEALSKVKFPYHLKIAGSGEAMYIKRLQAYAEELGISANVEWCGWKSGDEKFTFLESLNLFVLPSYNENFAIVVPEALFSGTAVLVSNKVGLASYVVKNGLGYICETTASSILMHLNAIYTDSENIERIRMLAPAIIKKDFSGDQLAAEYVKAYKMHVTKTQ